jgi:hypothetical protein
MNWRVCEAASEIPALPMFEPGAIRASPEASSATATVAMTAAATVGTVDVTNGDPGHGWKQALSAALYFADWSLMPTEVGSGSRPSLLGSG